ncbi:hypothetical protein [Bradyrhizobium sp. Ec3.3]|uniref:hypothetical protein n=1 Tax=Bradyrhizobium sp. Ec3.3 TaxID=189753 RepID=UPI00041FE5FC|nr:hypothetical protein [Bradyrhizobium sp. Ec3.3]
MRLICSEATGLAFRNSANSRLKSRIWPAAWHVGQGLVDDRERGALDGAGEGGSPNAGFSRGRMDGRERGGAAMFGAIRPAASSATPGLISGDGSRGNITVRLHGKGSRSKRPITAG